MTSNIDQAKDDLAFLKRIVGETPSSWHGMGVIYGGAGILYGIQCIICWVSLTLPGGLPPLVNIINGILPTVLFIVLIAVFRALDPRAKFPAGAAQRAMGAALSGAGISNLVLIAVFATEAFRREDFSIWLFYGVTVCVLQGAVWYGAAVLRRRWWMGGVAAGWMLTGLIAGFFIPQPAYFVLTLAFGLFAFMAAPGYALYSIARAQ